MNKMQQNNKRVVECKYGANCKYGDKCKFAHTKGGKKFTPPTEVPHTKKERRELNLKRKLAKPGGELLYTAKQIWNKLRLCDIDDQERFDNEERLMKLLTGHVVDFALKHDASRVIQCALKYGNDEQRTIIIKELLDHLYALAISKHGCFLVKSVLRYMPSEIRKQVIESFYGHIYQIGVHTIGSRVLEFGFYSIWTKEESELLYQEFYHRQYNHVKDPSIHNLTDVIKKCPLLKNEIIENMTLTLSKMDNKGLYDHSFVHYILNQYLQVADYKHASSLLDSLSLAIPAIMTTEMGAHAAVTLIGYMNNKEKKKFIKTLKDIIYNCSTHIYSYKDIIRLLCVLDDTKTSDKNILSELYPHLLDLSYSQEGAKVILSILAPENNSYFDEEEMKLFVPPTVETKNEAGSSETLVLTKKDKEKRIQELQTYLQPHIESCVRGHIPSLLSSVNGSNILIEYLRVYKDKEVYNTISSYISLSMTKPDEVIPEDATEDSHGDNQETNDSSESESEEEEKEEKKITFNDEKEEEEMPDEEEDEDKDADKEEEEEEAVEEEEAIEPYKYKDIWEDKKGRITLKRLLKIEDASVFLSTLYSSIKGSTIQLMKQYPAALFLLKPLLSEETIKGDIASEIQDNNYTILMTLLDNNKLKDTILPLLPEQQNKVKSVKRTSSPEKKSKKSKKN
ncbi:hypothetical protein WA158_002400 [Blastocystis sp. Blastoise]